MTDPTTPTPAASDNPKAALFDALVKAGIAPADAQRKVNTAAMAGMSNADAYDLYASGKAAPKSKATDLLSPSENREGAVVAGLDKGVNALAFGQGHRIAAATQALLGNGSYRENDDKFRTSLDEDKQDHPVASLVGSVAGAVANPLNKFLAPLGVVKAGMLAGALQGSGDAKDDLESQVEGAGAGVLGGALFGGLIHGASKLLGPSAADKAITETLKKSPEAMDLLDHMVSAGRGKITSLADLSPEFRALADRVANENPEAYAAIKKMTDARQADQGARVLASARKSLGDPQSDELVARLATQRRSWARSLMAFGGLRAKNQDLPVAPLRDLMTHPEIKNAMSFAMTPEDINNAPLRVNDIFKAPEEAVADPSSPYAQLLALGVPAEKAAQVDPETAAALGAKPGRALTYVDVSNLQSRLNDQVKSLFRRGLGDRAEAIKTVRDGVRKYLADNVPEHAEIAKTYGFLKSNEEAVAQGAADWSRAADARTIAGKMAGMSPAEIYGYRHGVASSLIKQAAQTATNRNAASPFLTAGEDLNTKLKAVFGDEQTMDKFLKEMDSEGTLSALKSATGGSPSARRMADRFKLNGLDISGGALMGAISHSPVLGVAGAIARPVIASVRDGMHQRSQAAIGRMLTTQGPEAIQALLARLSAQNANGPISAATGPAGVGVLDAFKNYLGQ